MNNQKLNLSKNNFFFALEDAINLFLGDYVVKDSEGKLIPCPLFKQKGWKHVTVRLHFNIFNSNLVFESIFYHFPYFF